MQTQLIARRTWRFARWVVVAAGAACVWACNARSFEAPVVTPRTVFLNNFQQTLNRQIDLLFMIDDSSSMETAQANLKANVPNFMNVLKALPGGLPDLHLAVVSQDMGAGDGSSIAGCSQTGDAGQFHFTPTDTCTATGLDPAAHFLIDSGGATPTTNFGTQDITSVFQCIAVLGANGCGLEAQLFSVAHALGADNLDAQGNPQPPPGNEGFLRSDAYLGIVLVTNEDDCSAPWGTPLFNPVSSDINSTYGPIENFICNEWGHLCSLNGGALMKPSRFAPNNSVNDVVTYSPPAGPNNCTSAEGQGLLSPVGDNGFAGMIKKLKTDPTNQILVAGLIGPPYEYTVTWKAAPVAGQLWPTIRHSCGSENSATSFADPGVREDYFITQFGANGLEDTFCQSNYGQSLATIAQKLSALLAPQCITGVVATRPNSSTLDCTVTDVVPNMNDPTQPVQTPLPACADNGGMTPCWQLDVGTGPSPGNGCAPTAHVLDIMRGGAMPPNNTKSTVNCSICTPGYPDPSVGCP
jgi:hypothetical protein